MLLKPVLTVALLPIGFFGFIGYILYVVIRSTTLSLKSQQYLRAFAAANSLVYQEVDHNDQLRPGTLFHVAGTTSQRTTDCISGQTTAFAFTLLTHEYTVNAGKQEQTYTARVAELKLPKSLPQLVIDSRYETDSDAFGSVLPIQFSDNQRLTLEGSFSKYFAVYSPPNQQISALSLLTPDVMEAVMEHVQDCDLEIIQDKLYFYWRDAAHSQTDYQQIFATVDAIWAELGKQIITQSTAQFQTAPVEHEPVLTKATGLRAIPSDRLLLYALVIMFFGGPIVFLLFDNQVVQRVLSIAACVMLFIVYYYQHRSKRARGDLERFK